MAVRALLLLAIAGSSAVAELRPPPKITPKREPARSAQSKTSDFLGVFRTSKSSKEVIDAGARVVDFPEENSFVVVWTPPNWKSGRIMVALHGTGGTAYEEMKDELPLGRQNDYAVVAVNWFNAKKREYFGANHVYSILRRGLRFLQATRNNDLKRVALEGFSRGGAISYEVASIDLQQNRYFKLVIAHSGGIPLDGVVAPGESRQPGGFFRDLATFNRPLLQGTRFFLYSGDRDEQWGPAMSEQMTHAEALIKKNGGTVVERIQDPKGAHLGYRKSPDYQARAIAHFIKLTP